MLEFQIEQIDMWSEAINIAISNGIFAVLFVSLLLYQLKDSAKRESKYQNTISKLANHLAVVENIKEDIEEIKTFINKKGGLKKSERKTESEN